MPYTVHSSQQRAPAARYIWHSGRLHILLGQMPPTSHQHSFPGRFKQGASGAHCRRPWGPSTMAMPHHVLEAYGLHCPAYSLSCNRRSRHVAAQATHIVQNHTFWSRSWQLGVKKILNLNHVLLDTALDLVTCDPVVLAMLTPAQFPMTMSWSRTPVLP